MAIIYSYPQINLSSISADDLMIISDMNADGRPTKSLTLKNLADFVTSTGTGTGTTNKIIKWSDGPAGLLGDSIMTESATQIDLAGTFLSTSSPTATAGPVHAIRADQSTTTGGAFNIALYGDTKHTGATQANSNYGIYTKAEFEGTGGYTGIILGGSFEGRYDGSGANGANASIYGAFSKARVTAASSGDIQYMIANNVTSEMDSGTTTDVEFLQGQHTNVTLNSGNISGDIAVNILDFDYTAGTLQGDFAYLQIQNDPVPTPVSGTARAINSDSTLPSHFSGDVEIPLIPTANAHATSKQYVDTQIASIPAGLVFKGNWNANTNTPTLASGVGTVGNYYVVSVAGNTNLDGITDWEVGDWAVFVEVGGVDKWDKIDQTFVQGSGATGQVTFWNSINAVTGDNAFFWDNTNKRLGIGTSSPSEKLQVTSSSNPSIKIQDTTNGFAQKNTLFFNQNIVAGQTDVAKIYTELANGATASLDNPLKFATAQRSTLTMTDRMVIDNLGNVGIGTSSPDFTLDVATSDYRAAEFSRPAGTNCYIVLKDQNTTNDVGIGATTNDLKFRSGNSDNMILTSAGNLGIGTTSPATKLEVNGGIGVGTTGGTFLVRQKGDTSGDGIALTSSSATSHRIFKDAAGTFFIGPSTDPTAFTQSLSGNVGIGTTSPAAKLDVIGRIGLNDGNSNVSIGDFAGDALTTGEENIAIGYAALTSETTGKRSVAIGNSSLESQNNTSSGDMYNVAVGFYSGKSITTGVRNIAMGAFAGYSLTTGNFNTAIGYNALSTEDAGNYNTAIGYQALMTQDAGSAYNTAVGFEAGKSVTTGTSNTLIGGLTGDALTTGNNNVALGYASLSAETKGDRSVAIGNFALQVQNNTTNVDVYNTAVGYSAGSAMTTGIQNTLIGGLAGDALTTANNNIAIGYLALTTETSGGNNIAIGVTALQQSNGANYNIAIGRDAGQNVTTGYENTLIGGLAGDALTTGVRNVAIGHQALSAEDEHGGNTAIGYRALTSQNANTNAFNIAIGFEAGRFITTGATNTLIGSLAGDAITTGGSNVVIGYDAADVLLDGAQNTLVGDQVAGALTSGDENTYIGRRAASSATTGNQNVAIGAGVSLSSATVSNEVNISNNSVIARFQGAAAAWSFVSDARDKKEIEDLELGVEFINKLKPRKFKWDLRDSDVDKNKKASGFVAQEIQEILNETGVDYTGIVDTNNPDQYTVAQANIIPMLVKAVQELSAEVKMLKNK